ncbi:hypothetical protein BKA82DRAFT_3374034 [Pisolithus tinctorius]|nr:hypothetical protein BKA82DRAFT_3374034 [Pisolithus tinctorius]
MRLPGATRTQAFDGYCRDILPGLFLFLLHAVVGGAVRCIPIGKLSCSLPCRNHASPLDVCNTLLLLHAPLPG